MTNEKIKEEVSPKIYERIQKLLKLAGNNPNENEKQSAMLKAQEMMLKYGVKVTEIGEEDEKENLNVKHESLTKMGKTIWWQRELARVISKNFKCRYYVYNGGAFGKKLMFMGLENDVDVATLIFKFAVQEVEKGADRCYAKFYNEGKPTKGIKADYQKGFVMGLDKKFEEQVKTSCLSLMLVIHPVVVEAIKDMGFTNIQLPVGKMQNNSGAIALGYEDGKNFDGNPNKIED